VKVTTTKETRLIKKCQWHSNQIS